MSFRNAQLLSRFQSGDWISEADFRLLCANSPDYRTERTADGKLVLMPPAFGDTSLRNAVLTTSLGLWSHQDSRGEAFDSSAGFTLPNGAIRSPDASWIELTRWEGLTRAQREDWAPLCPDFVAELRSVMESKTKTQQKMSEYLEQGARLGWLIDLVEKSVEIYRPGRPVEVLERPTQLSGEDVLPGFVLDLDEILYVEH